MELDDVLGLVREVAPVDAMCADRDVLASAVDRLRRVRAWVDACELTLVRGLGRVSSFPEKTLAEAGRTSLRDADRVVQRANTATEVPVFTEALAAGSLSAGHLDVFARGLRRLEPDQRRHLADNAERLVLVAERTTRDEFDRVVKTEVRRLEADAGTATLERQRRNTRLRTWVDRDDGMWCLHGRFDPLTGLVLAGRLGAMADTLFADTTPETCPSDPVEKQDHLRALALVALSEGRGPRLSRPEIVVVVDTTTPDVDGRATIDWGLPVELPERTLVELYDQGADVHGIVVRNGVVLHAPGRLNLARSTRLANRAQRRALRAIYATCATPGCTERFDNCHLHHVHWWEHGGTSDLHNLVPLCSRHHHAVHDNAWTLTLGPHRSLTMQLPDGQIMTTGPPTRRAAA